MNQIIYLDNGEMKFIGSFPELLSSGLNMDLNLAHLKPKALERLRSRQLSRTDSQQSDILLTSAEEMSDTRSFLGSCQYLDITASMGALNVG